jgi:hypothetical protein
LLADALAGDASADGVDRPGAITVRDNPKKWHRRYAQPHGALLDVTRVDP